MTKRVTYDRVEDEAMKAIRLGHDVKLYFRHTGMLEVFHNGESVLKDGPRDYSVALALVKKIVINGEPAVAPKNKVTEKDVRRGKAEAKPKAAKKKPAPRRKKPPAKRGSRGTTS